MLHQHSMLWINKNIAVLQQLYIYKHELINNIILNEFTIVLLSPNHNSNHNMTLLDYGGHNHVFEMRHKI